MFLNLCRPDYTVLSSEDCKKCGNANQPGEHWPNCPGCPFIDGETAINRVCNYVGKASKKDDMWYSFPSGHSSTGMYSSVFLAIYLHIRMSQSNLLSRYLVALQPVLIFASLLFGILSVISRVPDNKHHLIDVVAGGILGVIAAFFIFLTMALPIIRKYDEDASKSCTNAMHDDEEAQQRQNMLESPL